MNEIDVAKLSDTDYLDWLQSLVSSPFDEMYMTEVPSNHPDKHTEEQLEFIRECCKKYDLALDGEDYAYGSIDSCYLLVIRYEDKYPREHAMLVVPNGSMIGNTCDVIDQRFVDKRIEALCSCKYDMTTKTWSEPCEVCANYNNSDKG